MPRVPTWPANGVQAQRLTQRNSGGTKKTVRGDPLVFGIGERCKQNNSTTQYTRIVDLVSLNKK